MQLQKIEEECL
jgi:hypothetical protein